MRSKLLIVLIYTGLFDVLPMSRASAEVPQDVLTAIETLQREERESQERAARELKEESDQFLAQMKKLQDSLTMAARLDEAVLVRNFLREFQLKAAGPSREAWIQTELDTLPELAQGTCRQHLTELLKIRERVIDAQQQLEKRKQDELHPLFLKYTQEGNLDAVLAIRDALEQVVRPKGAGPTRPGLAEPVPATMEIKLSTDPEMARRQHREAIARLSADANKQAAKILPPLISQLKRVQATETQAARLDQAVAIRDLVTSMQLQQDPAQALELARKKKSELAGDAATAIGESLQQLASLQAEIIEKRKDYNLALARILEPEVRRSVMSDEVNRAGETLREYLMLKDVSWPVHWLRSSHSPPPELPSSTNQLTGQFERTRLERLKEFEDKESQLRKDLIKTWKDGWNSESGSPAQQAALTKSIAFAEADYAHGFHGMRLFRVPDDMPKAGRTAWATYQKEMKTFRKQLSEQQDAAVKALESELQPVLKDLADQGEYETVLVIRYRLPEFRVTMTPIAVKVARSPYSSHLWDGYILEARGENSFLVAYRLGEPGEWLPRSRIQFAPDDVVEIAPPGRGQTPPGPGVPVLGTTRLQPGQKAVKFWGSSWYPVTIRQSTPQGVLIDWDTFPNRQETVPRADLRLIEED
ncbi:MAG: hypothetical protein KDA80_07195 [Planctomycetaceae bacterium]|nr:hypothetical protein [Planctomycetaceae bacterium]